MLSRSLNNMKPFTLLAIIALAGCANNGNDPSNPNPTEEISDTASAIDTAMQTVTISGYTVTVDGVPLANVWVAIADDATQQVVSETTSDESGNFIITLEGTVGDYTLLASYQNDSDVLIVAWQGFSVSDDAQDYEFDLTLSDVPVVDDSGATPPPSGACYLYYNSRQTMCSWHIWYVATYYTGAWYCFYLGGGVTWVPVGSC